MAYGETPILALFFRDGANERAKEFTFADFLRRIADGYQITERNHMRIVLGKMVQGKESTITIYLPEPEQSQIY